MNLDLLFDITIAFLSNTLLLMGISIVYSLFPNSLSFNTRYRKIIMGIVVGIIGIAIMSNHYELAPGLVFDARSVAMLLTGMFLGLIPTIIAAIFMSIFRLFIGGDGAFVGVLWVLASGVLGLLWRKFRLKGSLLQSKSIRWYELYLYGLFTQFIMVLLLLLLPYPKNFETFRQVTAPILIIYPIGSLLIAQFMITQRVRFFQNQKTLESEVQYRNLFNDSQAILILLNPQSGKIEDTNQASLIQYGYTRDEMLSLHAYDLSTLSKEEVKEAIHQSFEVGSYSQVQHIRKDGSIMDVEIHSGPTVINGVPYLYSTIIDVSSIEESKRLFLDADEKLKATFQSAGEGIIVTDENGHISLINPKAKEIMALQDDSIGNKIFNVCRIHSAKQNKPFKEHVYDALRKNITFKSDQTYSLISNDDQNTIKAIDFTISPINTKDELNHGAILVIRDITLELEQQEEIRYISQHDFLTGLHNRYFFEAEIHRLDTERQLPLTLILGDVNGLKLVNDTFTHLEGDNLLIEIATIFKKAVRQEDIVARWGGDEFVILLPQTSLKDAQKVYDRIKDLCIKSMYDVITPSISVGIATKTDPDEDIFDILKIAEAKMYREKMAEGKSMRSNLIATLEHTIIEKSYETESHSKNMMSIAENFGAYLNLSQDDLNSLSLLARLHDIGKISVSNALLNKLEPLTDDDWDKIKIHSETGARIVKAIPELKQLTNIILHHHEHWDGSGYPHNLKGETIPYLSRIISIVDAYEVMISGSTYKNAISLQAALTELGNNKGTQFDPTLTDKFIEMITTNKKDD